MVGAVATEDMFDFAAGHFFCPESGYSSHWWTEAELDGHLRESAPGAVSIDFAVIGVGIFAVARLQPPTRKDPPFQMPVQDKHQAPQFSGTSNSFTSLRLVWDFCLRAAGTVGCMGGDLQGRRKRPMDVGRLRQASSSHKYHCVFYILVPRARERLVGRVTPPSFFFGLFIFASSQVRAPCIPVKFRPWR